MLGITLLILIGLLLLLAALRLAASGDLRGMAKLISTRSAEEEVEDEIRDLKDRAERKGGD